MHHSNALHRWEGEQPSPPTKRTQAPISLRLPKARDGRDIHQLVKKSGVLEVNSEYAYSLLGTHFQESCVIAHSGSKIAGFVSAYIPKTQPDVLFIWQVGVDRAYRKRGLALTMLKEILSRPCCAHTQYIHATIAPSNTASRSLFSSLARDLDVPFHERFMFPSDYFSAQDEDEPLFVIGPLRSTPHSKGDCEMTLHQDPSHPLESRIKSYVRKFPFVAKSAKRATIVGQDGTKYLDFLSGAGTLNYGHNNEHVKKAVMDYLAEDGILHGLDMATEAKNTFIQSFSDVILKPRGLNYLLQFCGPTGTNAVEAAIKLARKVTQRVNILAFTGGFHGMTLGSLALTSNPYHKEDIPGSYSPNTTFMPYGDTSSHMNESISHIRQYLEDNPDQSKRPAAMVLETIQGEGGVNVASPRWLRAIRKLCDEFGMLLIVDDIQMGCGRTGDFFSFEEAGIVPDIVTLSKSIGAYGLPMALVLLKPELDIWKPAEHNGTFRGHNLAFVAATEAINHYWKTDDFSNETKRKAKMIEARLQKIVRTHTELDCDLRGRGFVWALEAAKAEDLAGVVQEICFDNQLIIETCGRKGQALKLLPPLVATDEELQQGLDIIEAAYAEAVSRLQSRPGVITLQTRKTELKTSNA